MTHSGHRPRPNAPAPEAQRAKLYSNGITRLRKGTEHVQTRYEDFASGVRMPSLKYHREQAKILAGLALSTTDAAKADKFKLAAMEHLEQAEAAEVAEMGAVPTPSSTDKNADRTHK
jgi:hypothetical protein